MRINARTDTSSRKNSHLDAQEVTLRRATTHGSARKNARVGGIGYWFFMRRL
jgi:hypothetical protein